MTSPSTGAARKAALGRRGLAGHSFAAYRCLAARHAVFICYSASPSPRLIPLRAFGLPPDDLTELGRRGRRGFGVDHAMTIRVEKSQIADAHPAFAGLMQRNYVMTLDIAFAAVAVDLLEVKPACRVGAAVVSYEDACPLARKHGQTGWTAVDGWK